MEHDEYFEDHDHDDQPDYRAPEEISSSELSQALSTLHLLGDDPYLRMQAYNLAVVDQFIMQIEYGTLRKLIAEESTPGPEAMFLSAQSQMWIFAAYEILRTWRKRAEDMVKWHENGGLEQKAAALEKDIGYVHPGRQIQADILHKVIDDPAIIEEIKYDLRATTIPFSRIEFIRVALAKHEVHKKNKSIAYAPGYGRINQWCGSLDYQLEKGGAILGNISRRDIADELRAIADRGNLPSDEDLASFVEFMKGPPVDPFSPRDE